MPDFVQILRSGFRAIIGYAIYAAQEIWGIGAELAHSPYFAPIAALVITAISSALFIRIYRKWRAGWVSLLVEKQLRAIGFDRSWQWLARTYNSLTNVSLLWRSLCRAPVLIVHCCLEYIRRDLWVILKEYYVPSFTTAVVAVLLLSAVLFLPDPPQNASLFLHPAQALSKLVAKLDAKNGLDAPEKLFEGLVAVVIALIFFVAESIRSGKSTDERRVLLKLSNLWPLGLLITILPLTFLYAPGTGLVIAAAVCVVGLTLFTFARVLRSLLSPNAIAEAQIKFLRQRIRRVVTESAKQRIANRILTERVGSDKEISVGITSSTVWLPGGANKYKLITLNNSGFVSDINLGELSKLASLVRRQMEIVRRTPAPQGNAAVTAPAQRSRRTEATPPEPAAFLLRRFGEEPLDQNSLFTRKRPVLAIRKSLVKNERVLRELEELATQAFRFNKNEPPSHDFRVEMKSTKDRLISAINTGSLGEIDELRKTYLLVAEEFLIALNDFGGGYSAEQAKEERSAFFQGWSEVRWLREDIRDLIEAASRTNNEDVITRMTFLPFAIATRAVQAGDQLLFQEFMTFGSFIYSLGRAKGAGSRAGELMMERSWRYVREILRYSIEPALSEENTDDD